MGRSAQPVRGVIRAVWLRGFSALSGRGRAGWSDEAGAATVEFALTVCVWLFWIMVSLQMAMIVVQYFSVMQVTRDTARWAGIRPDSSDAAILAQANTASNALPGAGGFVASDITITPSCPTPVAGRCANRVSGQVLSVAITPNLSRMLILPTNFRMGALQLTIPTTLPAYQVTVMIE
jgi:Flp pilus assembly protein TadG